MIHKERSKRKGNPFWAILLVVTLSLCLLALVSWLKIESFKWIFELAVLIAAVAAVYYVLRVRYMEYSYTVIGDTLVFKQNMGKGERYIFSLDFCNLRRLIPGKEVDAEAKRLGVSAVSKYYIPATELPVWGLVYYDTTYNCEKILTFKPSEELLAILSKKTIDKQG